MSHPNLQEIHQLGLDAVKAGREVLLHYFGRLAKVQEKNMAGLVSEADVESEKVIAKILSSLDPSVEILGEEQSYLEKTQVSESRPGRRWIIDPLDGTTNYIHKFFAYCISIGLEWDGELIYGIVDLPALGFTYHATKGGGAFKNGEPIHVSGRPDLKSSLIATGFAVSRPDDLDAQLAQFGKILRQVRGVRRAGSAAIDLCLVAEGVYDAYWESKLQPWDTAGGVVIVSEAGGKITNGRGEAYSPFHDSLIASNGLIHSELMRNLQ